MTNEITSPPLELLKIMADGELHSGEELAQVINVSRTAVWKQIKKLENFGLTVESLPSKGYRLENKMDFLSIETIRKNMSVEAIKKINSFDVFPVIDSTNSYLLNSVSNSNINICTAEFQTAGRGRRGRTWISPFGQNIYLSLSTQIETGLAALDGLSLAVGVVVVEALKNLSAKNIELKWPNDILWRDEGVHKKLGGVLIEAQGDPQGNCKLVVGLGLNVRANQQSNTLIDQPWSCLQKVLQKDVDRNFIIAKLLDGLIDLLVHFERRTFSFYRDKWQSHCAFLNESIELNLAKERQGGIFLGVDDRGALLLKTKAGVLPFYGGEISMRRSNLVE